jgi:hypothetical protein
MSGSAATAFALKFVMYSAMEAAEGLDRAQRELRMVQANNPSPEMLIQYQHRVEDAEQRYRDSIRNLAATAGVQVAAIATAFVGCAPTLLLPV